MQKEDLEREVFGGSDSELSDAEDGQSRSHHTHQPVPNTYYRLLHIPDAPQQRRRQSPLTEAAAAAAAASEESSGDSGDDYVQAAEGSERPKKAKRVRREGPEDGGEVDEEGAGAGTGAERAKTRRPTAKKRKRRQQLDEEDLSQMTPEQGPSFSLA